MLELDRPTDAATAFARVLRFQPDHVAALFHEGVLLARRGRYAEAEARWRRVVDIDPRSTFAGRARLEIRDRTDLETALDARAGA